MRTAERDVTVAHDVPTVTTAVDDSLVWLGARRRGTPTSDRIEARTGASARSVGEDVVVEWDVGPGGTHVRITVSSALRTTLLDYGSSAHVADTIARAVADPAWAHRAAAQRGTPVVAPGWRWIGVAVAAVAAGLACLPGGAGHRGPLVVAAAVAAGLWSVAILTGSIGIRRRGQFVPPWAVMVPLAGTLIVGSTVADALVPPHAGFAVSTSAHLSCLAGAFASTVLTAPVVRAIVVRSRRPLDRG